MLWGAFTRLDYARGSLKRTYTLAHMKKESVCVCKERKRTAKFEAPFGRSRILLRPENVRSDVDVVGVKVERTKSERPRERDTPL